MPCLPPNLYEKTNSLLGFCLLDYDTKLGKILSGTLCENRIYNNLIHIKKGITRVMPTLTKQQECMNMKKNSTLH